jgi:hypothetical protein
MATVYPGTNILLDLTSTTTGAGSGYRVPPDLRLGGVQAIQVGSSAGVTVTSSGSLQVSNDGSNWSDITGSTLAINGTTPQTAALALQSSLAGPWGFIRASYNAGSSTTTASTAYSYKIIANFAEAV